MKRSLVVKYRLAMKQSLAIAVALFALNMGIPALLPVWTSPAAAQGAPQCAEFPRLSAETKKKADAVQAAINAKADRKQVCALLTTFVASEATVIKFLEDNKVWCGVPDQAIAGSKTNHEKSIKFKTMACAADAAPQDGRRRSATPSRRRRSIRRPTPRPAAALSTP